MNEQLYSDARITRNHNLDGQFFFAVKTTGIFCRPSCPSPTAKEENVTYYTTIFAAMDDGFRPCLRCRPDLHTDYCNKAIEGGELVKRTLHLIYDGYLINHSIADLADHLFTSERNLRKLFNDHLGIAPSKVAKYHRGLFARRLLLTSSMTVTDIAYASGFNSIRQFNDVFKALYQMSPSDMRQKSFHTVSPETSGISIPYSNDFSFETVIGFMKPRALVGIEIITDHSYTRTFRLQGANGFFTVTNQPEKQQLLLTIHCDDVRVYMPLFQQVKRMFDLNTAFSPINEQLSTDPLLKKGMVHQMVPRLPVAYNPFEFVIRAILGQVVSVTFATTLACYKKNDLNYYVIPEIPYYLGPIATIPYILPGSEELAKTVVANMQEHDMVIMGNHGQVTVARDFNQVIQNAVFFELACEIILRGGSSVNPLDETSINELLTMRQAV